MVLCLLRAVLSADLRNFDRHAAKASGGEDADPQAARDGDVTAARR
jgi:hypothetical protein